MSTESTEGDLARKLTSALDRGVSVLKPGTAYRLQLARQQALAQVADAQARGIVATGGGTSALAGGSGASLLGRGRFWLAGLALVGALAYGVWHWSYAQKVRDLAALDAALLTADLPIDAYLDKGFQTWLIRGERP